MIAGPYTSRQCPVCKVWVYCADGPFAENDRTKTLADWEHWEKHHAASAPRDRLGFPFFPWNEASVEVG
jgi:hypothetical protein